MFPITTYSLNLTWTVHIVKVHCVCVYVFPRIRWFRPLSQLLLLLSFRTTSWSLSFWRYVMGKVYFYDISGLSCPLGYIQSTHKFCILLEVILYSGRLLEPGKGMTYLILRRLSCIFGNIHFLLQNFLLWAFLNIFIMDEILGLHHG